MNGGQDFDVQVDEGGGIHVVERDDRDAGDLLAASPEEQQAAAAIRDEIAAMGYEEWAPWITAAAMAQVLSKGGPGEIDVSAVVADEVAKRLKYRELFAVVDPRSEVGHMLRALVSRVVSPMGMAVAGNHVCDLVPRIAPGEPCDRCLLGGTCTAFSCGTFPGADEGGPQ